MAKNKPKKDYIKGCASCGGPLPKPSKDVIYCARCAAAIANMVALVELPLSYSTGPVSFITQAQSDTELVLTDMSRVLQTTQLFLASVQANQVNDDFTADLMSGAVHLIQALRDYMAGDQKTHFTFQPVDPSRN